MKPGDIVMVEEGRSSILGVLLSIYPAPAKHRGSRVAWMEVKTWTQFRSLYDECDVHLHLPLEEL